ncbi:MAG: hypothetical protein IID37_09900 [Planctomycetes bacterium]|nr:hypothetical protein [Planctomycetota bacterium]
MSRLRPYRLLVVVLLSFGGAVAWGQTGEDAGVGPVTVTVTDVNGFTETKLLPRPSAPSDAPGGTETGADKATPRSGPINVIGPFTGTFQEGFDAGFPPGFFTLINVFGGQAVVRTTDGSANVHVTFSWLFFGTVLPHGGDLFMGSALPPVEWVFDTPALMFGGYFATNSGTDDAVADFYDDGGNLIAGGLVVSAPEATNAWVWNGWETTGPAIKRVVITGLNPWGGGFIMHDDMEYTPGAAAPQPTCDDITRFRTTCSAPPLPGQLVALVRFADGSFDGKTIIITVDGVDHVVTIGTFVSGIAVYSEPETPGPHDATFSDPDCCGEMVVYGTTDCP